MSQKQNIQTLLHKFIKNECNKKEVETVITYFKKVKGIEDLPSLEEVKLLLEGIPEKDTKVVRATSSEILKEAKRRETLEIRSCSVHTSNSSPNHIPK